eukprot:1628162-Pleurochrysis_carterae.AAC.1
MSSFMPRPLSRGPAKSKPPSPYPRVKRRSSQRPKRPKRQSTFEPFWRSLESLARMPRLSPSTTSRLST